MKGKLGLLAAVVPALILSSAVQHPAFSASTPAPVPNAIISAASSWGTAADS